MDLWGLILDNLFDIYLGSLVAMRFWFGLN